MLKGIRIILTGDMIYGIVIESYNTFRMEDIITIGSGRFRLRGTDG